MALKIRISKSIAIRVPSRTSLAGFLVLLFGVFSLAFMTADERNVAAPGFACVVMVLCLWMTLWQRDLADSFF